MKNRLILGDNLQVLQTLESESVDLCYIDPPFFSQRNYEIIWGDAGEIRSFTDRWAGGIEHYIGWLKERIDEIWRLLKPTGSIFVHCDWHADAYIRAWILDKLGGVFVNNIAWCYTSASNSKRAFPRKHDTIFWYAKSKNYTANLDSVRVEYAGGKPHPQGKAQWKEGVDYSKGKIPEDWWEDIAICARYRKGTDNNIGYPTQKPVDLLKRIIKASSNEGDVVLDAFCGGGTTLVAACKLNRKFIGIDESVHAIAVSRARIENCGLLCPEFSIETSKYDYNIIRNYPPFEFERFIINKFGGESNIKQVGDYGIDGVIINDSNKCPIQVKRSESVGRNIIDNFQTAMRRFDKKCKRGYIIAFSFGSGAVEEVARVKREEGVDIHLIRVDSIIPLVKVDNPSISYEIIDASADSYEVCFKSYGKNIEIWQWDWNYSTEKGFDADILRYQEEKITHTFKKGHHTVAVRGIDENGMTSFATCEIELG